MPADPQRPNYLKNHKPLNVRIRDLRRALDFVL